MRDARGKTMLVTGGDGLLGKEIFRRFHDRYEILSTDRKECDVTSMPECRRTVGGLRPAIVMHCAAYTAVDRAESEDKEAFSINVDGARNMAAACREHGSLLVAYSSDYVFDGGSTRPYAEEDPPRPLSVYGRSKLAAEEAIRATGCRHLIIRSQWLYGPHGGNFVFTVLDKARRGEVLRVVDDQVGCPTNAGDLAAATDRLIEVNAGGTFHFSNEGGTSWFGFASFILDRTLGGSVSVMKTSSSELSRKAMRPAYSVLSKEKYRSATGESPRPWEEALIEFLDNLKRGGIAT